MDANKRAVPMQPIVRAARPLLPLATLTADAADSLDILLWLSRRRALLRRAACGDTELHIAGELDIAEKALAALSTAGEATPVTEGAVPFPGDQDHRREPRTRRWDSTHADSRHVPLTLRARH